MGLYGNDLFLLSFWSTCLFDCLPVSHLSMRVSVSVSPCIGHFNSLQTAMYPLHLVKTMGKGEGWNEGREL